MLLEIKAQEEITRTNIMPSAAVSVAAHVQRDQAFEAQRRGFLGL